MEHMHRTSLISGKNERLCFMGTIIDGIQGRQEWTRSADTRLWMKNTIHKCRTDETTSRLWQMLLGLSLKPIPLVVLVDPIVGPTKQICVKSQAVRKKAPMFTWARRAWVRSVGFRLFDPGRVPVVTHWLYYYLLLTVPDPSRSVVYVLYCNSAL